ncbi:MAG: peptidoglycan recognition protein [Sandaracinus sp.]|nr:peptidoglycan recognition protein [Sandaracinus sp.]MCB9613998.1 peptidoglycan recognition protein [Sandaracinus sp.]
MLLLWVAAGCVNELQPGGQHVSHDHQELTVSGGAVIEEWAVEGDWYVSPRLMAADGASRAGVLVSLLGEADAPLMEARVVTLDGVGEWVPLEAAWSEIDQHVAVAELGETGVAAELRILRTDVAMLDVLRFTAVVPDPELTLDDAAPIEGEVGAASAEIRSELRGLGIVTREQWGARATRCTSGDSSKRRLAVHHTVTGSSDPARQMRGIQNFHMNTRGWCDVGYHFLVGSDGKIYEGRPLHLLGAHVGSNNTGNIGISFIGCYHTSGCSGLGPSRPGDSMIRVAGRLMGTLSRLYGISLSSSTVKGHRDHPGQSTTCPGDNLRPRIGEMINIGRSSTLSSGSTPSTPPPSTGGSCTHSYGGTYGNLACSAGYQCCSGSWRTRGACGACACVETTGERGCSAAAPSGPPAGASCTHSYGGRYANTACSPSYQCCNGSWRTRGSCGSCYCTESTGERGCGL